MLDILYYHYHQFYKSLRDDSQSNFDAILKLTTTFSLIIIFIVQFISVLLSCESLNWWICLVVVPIVLYIFYKRYYETERYYNILETKPLFFNNLIISKLITIFFFLASAGIFIFGMIYLHMVLEAGCRW